MRRWWPVVLVLLLVGGVLLIRTLLWSGVEAARPLPVPSGDQEIAWLHIPTSGETWENFVWGLKRTEMASSGAPAGLRVDDSGAFPDRTTAVPEVVIERDGFAGKLRVRWYKITNYATTEAWVKALAARSPAPLAVIGGWSSDRARELAEALQQQTWPGQKPLLLLPTATADSVYPEEENFTPDYRPPRLISLYERSFRFCFTNRQMAAAVTDFVLSDPALRPGPVAIQSLRLIPGAIGGGLAMFPWLASLQADLPGLNNIPAALDPPPTLPAFAVAWKDDPYSLDLSEQFREALTEHANHPGQVRLRFDITDIPFSTGRFARPNPYEAEVVDHILANLPRRGERTMLVIPTVTAPARRVLGALVQGSPAAARRLVAVTGDGIPVNALFRDGEFAWPVRSIPIPLVLFTHADPFDWDEPGGELPPRGYELFAPQRPGDVRSSTEDIQLFTLLSSLLFRAAFPDGSGHVIDHADDLDTRFRKLSPPFFDSTGNRLSGSGEHVVVLRPAPRGEGIVPYPDAVIDVYTRITGEWVRIRTRPIVQTVRPNEWEGGE